MAQWPDATETSVSPVTIPFLECVVQYGSSFDCDSSVLCGTCGGLTPSFYPSLVCPLVSATTFLTVLLWPGERGASEPACSLQEEFQAEAKQGSHLPGEQGSAVNCCGLGSWSSTPISTCSRNFLNVFPLYSVSGVIS